MKIIVGLTGPIGAGKSTVSKRFAEHGFYVIDADRVARKIVEKGSAVLCDLVVAFGNDILEADGSLNRKRLAERAFASREMTELLNSLTHPAIIKLINDEIASSGSEKVLLDAPQLFESGCEKICNSVVGVLADDDIRLRRVAERDSMTEEQIRNRMKVQFADSFYLEHCNHIVYNNSDERSLLSKVDELIEIILRGCE